MSTIAVGDRVRLKAAIGRLKAGEVGVVVEVYPDSTSPGYDGPHQIQITPSYDEALFIACAVFPSLGNDMPEDAYGFSPEGIDLNSLHRNPNVVPIRADEVEFVDSILAVSR